MDAEQSGAKRVGPELSGAARSDAAASGGARSVEVPPPVWTRVPPPAWSPVPPPVWNRLPPPISTSARALSLQERGGAKRAPRQEGPAAPDRVGRGWWWGVRGRESEGAAAVGCWWKPVGAGISWWKLAGAGGRRASGSSRRWMLVADVPARATGPSAPRRHARHRPRLAGRRCVRCPRSRSAAAPRPRSGGSLAGAAACEGRGRSVSCCVAASLQALLPKGRRVAPPAAAPSKVAWSEWAGGVGYRGCAAMSAFECAAFGECCCIGFCCCGFCCCGAQRRPSPTHAQWRGEGLGA